MSELTQQDKIDWFHMAGRENTGILNAARLYVLHELGDNVSAQLLNSLRDEVIDDNEANGGSEKTIYLLDRKRRTAK